MNITVPERNAITVISVDGELNAMTAQDLAEQLARSVRRCKNLVVELTRVRYISSAGIHVLYAALKACRQRSGDLRLVGLQKNVQAVLTTSGFLGSTQAFRDTDSAIASFSSARVGSS